MRSWSGPSTSRSQWCGSSSRSTSSAPSPGGGSGIWVYYQLGPGPSVIAEYERDVRLAAARQPKMATDGALTDDMIVALIRMRG
jgi:hypothetical protein